jgi:hypothetical protein
VQTPRVITKKSTGDEKNSSKINDFLTLFLYYFPTPSGGKPNREGDRFGKRSPLYHKKFKKTLIFGKMFFYSVKKFSIYFAGLFAKSLKLEYNL